MSLKAEYALVTGGSRGIGRGIALKLAAEGVKVGVPPSSSHRPSRSPWINGTRPFSRRPPLSWSAPGKRRDSCAMVDA
jgi:hypothetical protein